MFESMDIQFGKEKGTIEARRIIEMLSILESSPSDPNRVRESEPDTFDMGSNKVAIVYNKILRFSGIEVTDMEVAIKLRDDAEFVKKAYSEIGKILTALRPPKEYAPQVEEEKPQVEKKKPRARVRKKKVVA